MVDYTTANPVIRSPRQATTIFGLDGNQAPRKKSQFYVRFRRSGASGEAAPEWERNLGFMVKSVDRPSVTPVIEELNQYNKKRQVTTGYKFQPFRVSLYDTSDSSVMRMWNEYSQWYFGDFEQDGSAWNYDITTGDFNDTGRGFGFQPTNSTYSSLDSPYFFSLIEVYQVFGGEYTQFNLVNPKITEFNPDEMDYSVTEPTNIAITFSYEAILYVNGGEPKSISSDEVLSEVFADQFNGNTFDVSGATTRTIRSTSSPSLYRLPLADFRRTDLPIASSLFTNSGNVIGGGTLSQFGNYDFGSLSSSVNNGNGLAKDVSYLSTGNKGLSAILNLPVGPSAISNVEYTALSSSSSRAPSPLNAGTMDLAQGTLQGAGGGNNPYAKKYIVNNLVSPTAASAMLQNNSPTDQLSNKGNQGVALNSQTYGIVNAQRPSYSQIGYNSSSSSSYSSSSSSSYTTNQSSYNYEEVVSYSSTVKKSTVKPTDV